MALIEVKKWLENKHTVIDVQLFFQKAIRELHGTSPAAHKTQNMSKTWLSPFRKYYLVAQNPPTDLYC